MSTNSRIEWTDASWNPVTGCTKVSAGCKHCYAEVMAKRLEAMGQERYLNGFKVTLHPDVLDLPTRWRRPRRIFVNSMSDLFHEEVPEPFIRSVFKTMEVCSRHSFQVLTKRAVRLRELSPLLPWPQNVWVGVSIEDEGTLHRATNLAGIPAAVRFLSLEPLLSALPSLPLSGIDWVIVGGESGPGARPMRVEWVREIRQQCLDEGVAFFFKQWGGARKKAAGRQLDGRTWDEMPQIVSRQVSLVRDVASTVP